MTLRKLDLVVACSLSLWAVAATPWQPIGPFGGDARSLVADPHNFSHLYIGTSNSQIYASTNGGAQWKRLSEVSTRTDLVIQRLLVHPAESQILYAGAFTTGNGEGGGAFQSTDGGLTWKELAGLSGQSVRALVIAPGDSRVLYAGTLEGVFRSVDGGATWTQFSPPGHPEIRNVESLAVDPGDSGIVYVGTWHLPWKTTDAGATWFSIKEGILDDSDVFTITLDWSNHSDAFLGACSGIYHTESSGARWRKVAGIPFSARRTRALRQDPVHAATVYAGTTEGLWKTTDGGGTWNQMTSPTLIVNEVLMDPANPSHLFLATDRAGILESQDGGSSFSAANTGFAHRQIWRMETFEANGSKTLAALVRHDREYGGVFLTTDGVNWNELAKGFGDADCISLTLAPNGLLVAGATNGLYRFQPSKGEWERFGRLLTMIVLKNGRRGFSGQDASFPIPDFAVSGPLLYAATPLGVLFSPDSGRTWENASPEWNVDALVGEPGLLVAATATAIQISRNGSTKWTAIPFPDKAEQVRRLAINGDRLWVATDHGLLIHSLVDTTSPWQTKGGGFPLGSAFDVLIDPSNPNVIYAGSAVTDRVYVSRDGGKTFEPEALSESAFSGGHSRRLAIGPGGRLFMASGQDGVFSRVP